MEPIGYQDGITAFNNWFKKFGLWADAFEKWATLPNETRAITKPPIPPAIPGRGVNYDPAKIDTWPWPEKHERTERKLKDWHDSESMPPVEPLPPVPPPVPAKPWESGFPPITYNSGTGPDNTGHGVNPNARYNIMINCNKQADGSYLDRHNIRYDDAGKCWGGRTENYVPGLKFANSMDGAEPWHQYTNGGNTYGPNKEDYPAVCYER
jgi:hypothetical protein